MNHEEKPTMSTTTRILSPRHLPVWICATVLGPLFAQAQEEGRPDFEVPPGVEWIRGVPFAERESGPLALDILRPARPPRGLAPALIFLHGGGFRGGSRESGLSLNSFFAANGYFTITVDYRTSGIAPFPAAFDDANAAVRWLVDRAGEYHVDPRRIGAWGQSAGANLASLLGTTGRTRCAVDWMGPVDFLRLEDDLIAVGAPEKIEPIEAYLGGPVELNYELARAASPLYQVDGRDDCPFLILHGTADTTVPIAQAERFHQALRRAGVDSKLFRVQGAGHGFRGPEILAEIASFFRRHLEEAPKRASGKPGPTGGKSPRSRKP